MISQVFKLSRSPLAFGAAGFIWSALNDIVAVSISYRNGLHDQLFALNGVHNQNLVLVHVAIAYIAFPSIWAFYAWTDQAPRRMLRDLNRDGVFAEEMARAGEDSSASLGFEQRLWPFVYGVGIVLVMAGAYFLWSHPPTHEPGIVFFIRSHLPSTVVLWFMLWIILCRIVGAIFALDKAFRNQKVHLQPFHHDRVGGFGAMDRYARGLLFFSGFVLFALLIDFVQTVAIRRDPRDVILQIYIWAFVLLAPLLFLGTLWPAHAAMRRERDRILRALVSDDWRRTSFGRTGDIASAKRRLQEAEAARQLHDSIMAFPVWPFRIGRDVLLPLSESFAAAAIAHILVNIFLHPK